MISSMIYDAVRQYMVDRFEMSDVVTVTGLRQGEGLGYGMFGVPCTVSELVATYVDNRGAAKECVIADSLEDFLYMCDAVK